MNGFQRALMRLTRRFVPQLDRTIARAGGTLERLSFQNEVFRTQLDMKRESAQRQVSELKEAVRMAGGDQWQCQEGQARDLAVTRPLRESIADLELSLEDQGWRRLWTMSEVEFSRWGIQQIILMCRLYYIKNPLIKRGITVSSMYVFGRGFEVSSDNETANEVLKSFFNDPRNARELSQAALVDKEAQLGTDGNIFWCFFHDTDGQTLVRTIDPLEIADIVSDQNDSTSPRFYKRIWTAREFNEQTGTTNYKTREAWYVALGYEAAIPPSIGGIEVMRDSSGAPVRIYHRKEGGLNNWSYGCPRAYAAIDWARVYKDRLSDYATIVRALSRFAIDINTKGGAPAIAAFKQEMATTLANDAYNYETNPPPVTGSGFVHGPGTEMKAFDGAGKTPPPEEGRRLAHMVYMVFGLPETFFADVSVGNLATAKTLDRPTELLFMMRQEQWREDLSVIARVALEGSSTSPKGRLREAARNGTDVSTIEVKVDFPSILEGDITEEISSVVQALTLGQQGINGIDLKTGVRLLLTKLGVDNVEEILELMFPKGEYDPDRTKEPEEPEEEMDDAEEKPSRSKEAILLEACATMFRTMEKMLPAKD